MITCKTDQKSESLSSLVVFLCFFGSKPNHFLYIFFSFVSSAYLKLVFSLQKQLLYFTHHKLEQILQVKNQLLSTCNIFQLSKIIYIVGDMLVRKFISLICHILEPKTHENPAVI